MSGTAPPELIWPSSLLLPDPPKLVYFDMFVWRGLAEAASGRKSHPGFLQLLDECRKAVARRAAFFPVSETFVIETNKYGSEVGRRETARAVAEIGRLRSLASIHAVRRLELQSALTILVGAPQVELGPYLLLGRTLLHSFQQEMVMPLWDGATQASMNQSTDVWTEATTPEVSRQGGLLEFQMALLCTGNPDGALTEQSEVSLAREKHIAHLLGGENPRRTGSRLRDVLLATELGHGMSSADLEEGFENHGISLGNDSQLDRAKMTRIVRSMPSFEVSSEMRTRYQGKVNHEAQAESCARHRSIKSNASILRCDLRRQGRTWRCEAGPARSPHGNQTA